MKANQQVEHQAATAARQAKDSKSAIPFLPRGAVSAGRKESCFAGCGSWGGIKLLKRWVMAGDQPSAAGQLRFKNFILSAACPLPIELMNKKETSPPLKTNKSINQRGMKVEFGGPTTYNP